MVISHSSSHNGPIKNIGLEAQSRYREGILKCLIMVQLFRRRQGTSIQTYKHANIVLLYKRDIATQCLFASMYVCLQPISSITAGLIWLNFFCQLHLGHRVVLGQKNLDLGSSFSGNPEKQIWLKFSGNTYLDPNMF